MLRSTFLKVAACDERRLQFAKLLPRVNHEGEVHIRRRAAYLESKNMREGQIAGSCTHENVGKVEFSSDSVALYRALPSISAGRGSPVM
jgi:hypothetical protein